MTVSSGTSLGPYVILAPLGAGAMGEVWRARDTRLEREVAIKVLPDEFAGDEERLRRFEREAKTLASLNHPNVAQIFGVDQLGDTCYLVLELVEGETLEECLRRGPMALEDALDFCRQIADGLEAAHEAGVIHRDLKPANIRITPEGRVKVLDFGLAKPMRVSSETRSTDSVLSTEQGRLLGTPTYMAPEQARGKAIDRRIDVWAFGCVLFECLSGRRAFDGETLSDVLAAVLHTQPDFQRLPANTPSEVRALLARCLDKDPRQRLRDIGEARLRLDPGSGAAAVPESRGVPRAWRAVAAGLFLLVLALTALVVLRARPPDALAPGQVVRAVVELPAGAVASYVGLELSRDGSRLVLESERDGRDMLLSRSLGELEARWVSGSEGCDRPFLSPDGEWVAFAADKKLRLLPTAGGPAQDLADSDWGGGDWLNDDTLIYTPDYRSGLWTVSISGGQARKLTEPDGQRGELGHWWPQVLPGGEHVLFSAFSTPIERARIEVLTLATGQRKVLIEGAISGHYAGSGHLLFARKEALFAVPFDLDLLEVQGAAVPVVEGVATEVSDGRAGFAVAENGTLAYLPAQDFSPPMELRWVDRKGELLGLVAAPGDYGDPCLSADGRLLALTFTSPAEPSDVVLLDLARGTRVPLTSGGASDFGPLFTPSGERVVFVSERPVFDLYVRPADGSTPASPLVVTEHDKHPGSITPDGKTLLYYESFPRCSQIWTAALDGLSEPAPLLVSDSGDLRAPLISPDGRWLAYEAQDSRGTQIFLVPYPDVRSARLTVSSDGGSQAQWTRGGTELVYREGRKMLAVAFDSASGKLGEPQVLFEGDYAGTPFQRGYAVTGDGERFLMRRRLSAGARRVVIVTNWFTELLQKAPR